MARHVERQAYEKTETPQSARRTNKDIESATKRQYEPKVAVITRNTRRVSNRVLNNTGVLIRKRSQEVNVSIANATKHQSAKGITFGEAATIIR